MRPTPTVAGSSSSRQSRSPGAVGEGRVDVAHRVPARLVELNGAGHGVAEEQRALSLRGEHDAQVAGRVARCEHGGDPRRHHRVAADRTGPPAVGEAPPDVLAHPALPEHEVIIITGLVEDGRVGEHRPGVEVEEHPT